MYLQNQIQQQQFNLTFSSNQEKIEAVANIKEAYARVEQNNALFEQGQSNFMSAVYWFSALSRANFRAALLGADPPEENEEIVLPLLNVNGTTVAQNVVRRKRAANTGVDPECNNLPNYKNWAEDGKTAPVQDQGSCGKKKSDL